MNRRVEIVYLTGNYSKPRKEFFDLATSLWVAGFTVYCPHLNCAGFEAVQFEQSELLLGNLEILKRCDALFTSPDWNGSPSSIVEHQLAQMLKIKTVYSIPSLEYEFPAG